MCHVLSYLLLHSHLTLCIRRAGWRKKTFVLTGWCLCLKAGSIPGDIWSVDVSPGSRGEGLFSPPDTLGKLIVSIRFWDPPGILQ